ncbi:hypothetical protein BG011_003874 [Mortierella polycephala]|uniref:PLC-like phosphodiesterase n=1 Tax=Mortierella polycephala TaxID=41804 RepID=A0A9P6U3F9_9FUNG|nr:hypothetical protein BG011_003874 [Mortierella polycephala]
MRTSFILSAATALLASSLVLRSDAQQLCNGYSELCAKTYDKVAYATTHNAFAYQRGALAANQENDISTQLKDGIRALMLDSYNGAGGDIQLCHSSCELLDAGTLTKTLGQVKAFMDANPNEVVTIFFENAGKLSPAQFQASYAAAGLDSYSHTQPTGSTAWPTLTEMISGGKRLVTFLDTGADASVPWLMSEYDYVFETPYRIPAGAEYPCTIDRPKDQQRQMYVLNHFVYGAIGNISQGLDLPQPGLAVKTNGDDLATHINTCQSTLNQMPNFIAVDFYDKGSILQLVAQVNNVKWDGKGPTTPKSTNVNGAASAINNKNVKAVAVVAATAALGLVAF